MAADSNQTVGFDDTSEDRGTNPTNNRHFRSIAEAHVNRRTVLKGSLAAAATGFLAPSAAYADGKGRRYAKRKNRPLVDFAPATTEAVVANEGKTITVSPDYAYDVLIPWGTPIDPTSDVAPYEGDPNTRPTAAEQEQMIGIGHDGMWFFPINQKWLTLRAIWRGWSIPTRAFSSKYGFLCVNHEFGRNSHLLGKDFPETLEDVRLSQAAHGVSVVLIGRRFYGGWSLRKSSRNRRITVNTEVSFSGPVADSGLLDNAAKNVPAGTVNNCGSAPTPWGTYVTCEENFNGYFGYTGDFDAKPDSLQKQALERYGFSADGFGYGWFLFDPRFDVLNPDYANESNRFGWCVEIDPFSKRKTPVKRTAMGRFKHEACAFTTLKDGRVAAYMGDDERNDYCYKYESNRPWRKDIRRGKSPLDNGKLYVAKFLEGVDGNDGKGVGEWIELTIDNPLIQAAGLKTQAEVLTYTRLAADAVGATPMDRPEWTTIGSNGEVFWTLTNNNRKPAGVAPPEANPIFANNDGHIISTVDVSTTEFEWNIFILARNTRNPNNAETSVESEDLGFADYVAPADGGANAFTDPDAAWADDQGRLFIGTDGGQPDGLQDQLVVFDVAKGEYRRMLSGVASDEITGITTTPNYRTLFTNTQHPGDGNPAATNFPAPFDGTTIPRDCTIVLERKNGGRVGS